MGSPTLASEGFGTAGLSDRYASALFDLALDGKALDKISKDVDDLQAMINASDDLSGFISSPVTSADDQSAGIAAVAKKAKLNALTIKFLGLVAANRRLFALPGMISAFQAKMSAHRGEVRAQVTAPKKLTEKQISSLKAELKKATGSDVIVDVAIDADLLGGLVVQVGSQMVDNSIRSKLQRLELAMKGVA